ncbi:hypothetical protein Ahy_A07g036352 isoform B [Arachis hypogaea]|uniref:Uncharacterized protein n=1 Tax=Arachis hypogaea TaxID=3818 RepID=A0A445CFY6_ARAHY|nr:hypothetical protein Ahy_A07g036352 isoform B [Arachis hypogaea]
MELPSQCEDKKKLHRSMRSAISSTTLFSGGNVYWLRFEGSLRRRSSPPHHKYNLRSHIGGRRKGERERLLYQRVSKSGHYAITYEIEQSTSSINVSPPPVAPKLSKLLLWSERSPLSTSVLSKKGRICYPSWCYNKNKSEASVLVQHVLKWKDVEIKEPKEGEVANLMTGSQVVKDAVLKLNPLFTKNNLLVSVAAGVKLHDLQVGSCVEIGIPMLILFIALSQRLSLLKHCRPRRNQACNFRGNNVGGPRRTCCHYKKRSIKEKGSPNLLDLKFHPKTRSSTEFAVTEGGNFWPPNLIHHHLAKLLVLYIHILSSKNSTY